MTARPGLALAALLLCAVQAGAVPGEEALARGEFSDAREQLRRALEVAAGDVETARVHLLLGQAELQLSNTETAAQHFDEAARLSPDDPDPHYWAGRAYGLLAGNANMFRAGGYAKRSRGGFERALALDPQHIGARRGMIEYYSNAPRLYGGSTAAALEAAAELVEIDPLEGRLARAGIYLEDERQDEAREELAGVVRDFPHSPRGFLLMGFLEQADEDYESAHQWFAEALDTDGGSPDDDEARRAALYQIGRTAVFSGQRVQDGIEALQAYLRGPAGAGLPAVEWAHYRIGLLYEASGEDALARQHYDLAARTTDKELERQLSGH